jgi:ABC-2 type transport system permease protein
MATIGTGWGLGLAYRFKDMRAAAITQLTLFLGLFLTDAQTPIDIMEGWLQDVARWNPLTRVLHVARLGFVDGGGLSDLLLGIAVMGVLGSLAWVFALSGLRSLDD